MTAENPVHPMFRTIARACASLRACKSLALRSLALAALVSCVIATSNAHAQTCGSVENNQCPKPVAAETARGLSLGTGMRASAISTSALAYSPGALSLGNLYHIEGNVDYMSELKTVALGAAVVDSSTAKLGAGIGLRGFLGGSDQSYGGIDGRLGIAVSLSDAFSIGLGARYIDLSQDSATNSEGESTEQQLARGFTMDASIRIAPTPGLQFDIGALNFIDRDSPYVPTMLTGSMAFVVADAMSLGADVLADMTTFDDPAMTLGAGGEYLGGNSVPIRAGYSVDLEREIHAVSVGIGYTDQRLGLDIGLKQEMTRPGPADPETRVMGAFRYYVN